MKLKVFVVFIFTAFLCFAQDNTTLNNIREKYNSISAFSANFTQKAKSLFNGKTFNVEGTIVYKKGNKFKLVFGNNEIISDGNTIWNYDSRRNRVVINTLDEQNSVFTLDYFLYGMADKSEIFVSKDKSSLIMVPDNDGYFSKLEFYFDKEWLITKIILTDLSEINYNINLNNVKILDDVDDSKFVYVNKDGVEVVDFR